MGTFCLLLQFLHRKLNAVCLAKKMNKLGALKHKMPVTGNYGSDSNNDRHVGRELGLDIVASRHSNWEWNMVYSLCKHHLLKTIWVLRFPLRAQTQQNTNTIKHVLRM